MKWLFINDGTMIPMLPNWINCPLIGQWDVKITVYVGYKVLFYFIFIGNQQRNLIEGERRDL